MFKKYKKISMVLIMTLLFSMFAMSELGYVPVQAAGLEYYVSPGGSDSTGNGTIVSPYKTIQKARDVVRAQISGGMTSDVTVYLRGGNYYLDSKVTFDERDRGRNGYKITYRNYPGEEPIINGGQAITGWQPDTGNIYKTYVGTGWNFHTLYENGQRSWKARYPNRGDWREGYNTAAQDTPGTKNQFKFKSGDIPTVANPGELQACIWPGGPQGDWNWIMNIQQVSGINYSTRLVSLSSSTSYEIGPGSRYYVQGAKALLDAPGEFYLDSAAGYLYYYPRNLPISGQEIVVSKTIRILEIRGTNASNIVENIDFVGLTIRNSDANQNASGDGAIFIDNARYIGIEKCKLYNVGIHGIYGELVSVQ